MAKFRFFGKLFNLDETGTYSTKKLLILQGLDFVIPTASAKRNYLYF